MVVGLSELSDVVEDVDVDVDVDIVVLARNDAGLDAIVNEGSELLGPAKSILALGGPGRKVDGPEQQSSSYA